MAISVSTLSKTWAYEQCHISIIYTTDIHGCFFPYDFINGTPAEGSLARVATIVDEARTQLGDDNVILLDNGDFLQGQPSAYYYNFVDTVRPHLAARLYNYLGYDAVTIGNHDIETGHEVYDRVFSQLKMPVLGANVKDISSGQPYFKPYELLEAGGKKIAVIGLVTPAIPAWIPRRLWWSMEFEDMVETARHTIDTVRKMHNPDLVIGLFHSGHDSSNTTAGYRENESLEVARRVEGFDAVLMGHDHREYCGTVMSPSGRKVVALNPANNAVAVGVLDIYFHSDTIVDIHGNIVNLKDVAVSQPVTDEFAADASRVREFVESRISSISAPMRSTEALYGPSAIMTLIHNVQIWVTGAEISLAAPLSLSADISDGVLTMADMFKLYKYENNLCVIELRGRELVGYLEESYRQWLSPKGTYPVYNFDSASGINYVVDCSKPEGDRVRILSMADGSVFDPDRIYRVALNSYRAGGGGNHLTRGAGLEGSELNERVTYTSPKDIRFYLIEYLQKYPVYQPQISDNWRFVNLK